MRPLVNHRAAMPILLDNHHGDRDNEHQACRECNLRPLRFQLTSSDPFRWVSARSSVSSVGISGWTISPLAPGHFVVRHLVIVYQTTFCQSAPTAGIGGAKQPAQKVADTGCQTRKIDPTLLGGGNETAPAAGDNASGLSRSLPSEPGAARRSTTTFRRQRARMCLAVARRWEVHCPLFIDTTAIQLSETANRDSHHSRCPGDPKRPSRAGSDQVRDNEDGQYKPGLDHLRLEGKSHPQGVPLPDS